MGKVQQCRNGCGAYITVQEDQGKWKPFDVAESGEVLDLHNCPNSPYNQQGGGSTRSAPTTTPYQRSGVSTAGLSRLAVGEGGTTQGGITADTKRIFQILKELDTRLYNLEENQKKTLQKIEENTNIDTNKFVGVTQQWYDMTLPLVKTQIKKASDIYTEEKKDPISVNHGDKADRHEQAFRDRRKIVNEKTEDDDEFERTKQFVPENHNVDDDEEDDNNIETED